LKKPHSYENVQNKFQLFKDLQKFTKELSESKAQTIRYIAWNLSEADLEDRQYSYNFLLTERSEELVDEVLRAAGTSIAASKSSDVDLTITLDEEPDVFDDFNALVESLSASEQVTDLIENIAEKLKADEDAKRTGLDPLKLASEIHTKLETLDVTMAAAGTREALIAQLVNIRDKAANMVRVAERS
jgi:hypothetical protein